jgi:hypothetical protein
MPRSEERRIPAVVRQTSAAVAAIHAPRIVQLPGSLSARPGPVPLTL